MVLAEKAADVLKLENHPEINLSILAIFEKSC